MRGGTVRKSVPKCRNSSDRPGGLSNHKLSESYYTREVQEVPAVPTPRVWIRRLTLLGLSLAALAPLAPGQSIDARLYSEMHWRSIGPPRAGRARALSGVASQPNVFYIGFDNGGVWRSTDFGSTWTPLFDNQPTGSIGAIAVAPSDPNIIYVGAGAGIIRPDRFEEP